MRKLAMDLEALDIQSFEVEPSGARAAMGSGVTVTVPGCCVTITCGDSHVRACFEG